MAKTLAEYYASMGMALPSISERKKKYVGTVDGYTGSGTADDNNTLLAYLQGGGSSAPSTTSTSSDDMNSLPPELRGGARGLFLDDNGNYVDDATANKINSEVETALKYNIPMSEVGNMRDSDYKIPAGFFNDNPYSGMSLAEAQAKYEADLKAGGYDSTGTKTTQQKGTGAITTTKKLTAGNTNQLSPSSATLAEILKNMINPNQSEIDSAISNRIAKYKAESDKTIDEDAIRKSFKDRIQGSIDAINQTYASMLGNAKIRGQNNAGMVRSINARSGLLGSDFAFADEANINRANQDNENAIEAERLGLVQKLLMDAEGKADTSIKEARLQKQDAYDKLMETLTTRETRSAGQASKVAQYLVASGVKDAKEITSADLKTIRDTYGIDPTEFMTQFDKAITAKQTLDNTLNKDRFKTIGDGAQLYDTVTGKIIENTKNFSPSKTTTSLFGNTGVQINGVEDAMQRIAKVESSGNYGAVGPVTEKGNRAYGKYQVMDFNIPTWTKEVLGQSMTPQQFLASPQAQDAVAKAKLQEAYDKYGTWEDSASVWFSGRPMSGNTSKDVTGTSTPEYVQRFLGGSPASGVSSEAQAYIDAIKSGKMSRKEVLDSLGSSATLAPLRTQIINGLNSQETDSLGSEKTRQTLTTIDNTIKELESKKNLAGTFRTRNANNGWLNWSANENTAFVNTVDKLTGQLLRLDGVQLKAIFGPQISNADASTIKEIIGNALDPRNQTPEQFQTSLDDIKRGLESSKNAYNYTDNSQVDNGGEYNYERDLAEAKDAIARGADANQVMARFNAKYK